jgi:hypothetical protein
MADKPEAQAAAPHTVTSASVGTALVTGAGTITGITMNQPTTTSTDDSTPLTLLDVAVAPGAGVFARPLFSASLRALASEYEPRPGVALTPGITAPTWPKNLSSLVIPFANGLYVSSCPANMTFTVTA